MPEPKTINIKWPETIQDVPTQYANALWITHAGPEFFLVFGEFTPPPVGVEPPDAIEIRPIVKIAVTPDAMLSMAEAIRENVQKYQEKLRQEAEGEDASD